MIRIALSACCLMVASVTPALAGDAARGQEKSKACVACHGPDGNSASPEFPKIAGQNYDYLLKSLKDYKSGARKSPVMAPMGANLSTRDMEDLAAFYASQKGLVVKY
jgi:cytochrome c553